MPAKAIFTVQKSPIIRQKAQKTRHSSPRSPLGSQKPPKAPAAFHVKQVLQPKDPQKSIAPAKAPKKSHRSNTPIFSSAAHSRQKFAKLLQRSSKNVKKRPITPSTMSIRGHTPEASARIGGKGPTNTQRKAAKASAKETQSPARAADLPAKSQKEGERPLKCEKGRKIS